MTVEKKSKIGTVVRHSGEKTAVVLVERSVKHPLYKKYITKRKKFHIHDEKNEAKVGDKVVFEECRPMSKTKRWRLKQINK